MRRMVDELGRIVLPVEIRNALNIQSGATLDIAIEADKIVMCQAQDACLFCNSSVETIKFGKYVICEECRKRLLQAKTGDTLPIEE